MGHGLTIPTSCIVLGLRDHPDVELLLAQGTDHLSNGIPGSRFVRPHIDGLRSGILFSDLVGEDIDIDRLLAQV
jgi:hypothetical protein